MNKKQILIIDTDPGVDDALALTMLKNLNQKLETYEKIIYSSIGGNTSLENNTVSSMSKPTFNIPFCANKKLE